MKIFTIEGFGNVKEGAEVEAHKLKNSEVTIDVLTAGESGRGRYLGFIPVQGVSAGSILHNALLSKTRNGNYKLIADTTPDNENCIIVFKSNIGFRGSNDHTGDWDCDQNQYRQLPGQVLVRGTIAQGDAGRMGSGEQLIAIMPVNTVFAIHYSGRLYGAEPILYFKFDGSKVITVTVDEREALEVF